METLAVALGSFANHHARTPIRNVLLVLEPDRVVDPRAWNRWLGSFVTHLAPLGRRVRVLVRDITPMQQYEPLIRALGPLAHTTDARLRIGARVAAVTLATADLSRFEGALRVITARAMQAVDEGRLDEAESHASAADNIAGAEGAHALVVPIRFCVGNGFAAVGRFEDAIRHFRAAEQAAERAEALGDPRALRLRVLARFGTGAMLLSSPRAAQHAAQWYEATAPLCQALGDVALELDAHRVACLAYERAGATQPAWDAGVRALGCVDRLATDTRDGAMLGPLADALVRLTARGPLQHFRKGLREQLERRGMHETTPPR